MTTTTTMIVTTMMLTAGDKTVPRSGWELYFTHLNLVEPNHYPYPDGVVLPEQGVRFRHRQVLRLSFSHWLGTVADLGPVSWRPTIVK